nr:probable xyloglucan endotransglucosylase/hydrolase protein 30 [Ipomoea batatas]
MAVPPSLLHTSAAFFLVAFLSYTAAAFDVTTTPFDQGFTTLYGESNILRSSRDDSVRLHLNQFSGKQSTLSDHHP